MVWIASIRDKNKETVLDIVPAQDTELRALIRKNQAQASISKHDVASGKRASFSISVQCQLTQNGCLQTAKMVNLVMDQILKKTDRRRQVAWAPTSYTM